MLAALDGTEGYILSRSVEKNGRAVAFVFNKAATVDDGSSVQLDVPMLKDSYNYHALLEGLAYPTFYDGLFHDLRAELTAAVETARKRKLGIHKLDRTTEGINIDNLKAIVEDHVILPKLFRRLCDYINQTGTVIGFKEKLEESREPVLDLRTSNFTHFDTFIEQAAGSSVIKMTRRPEELVFDPMPMRPTDAFANLLVETEEYAFLA